MSKNLTTNNDLVKNAMKLAHDLRAPAMVLKALLSKQKKSRASLETSQQPTPSQEDSLLQRNLEHLITLSDHYLSQMRPKAAALSVSTITLAKLKNVLKQSVTSASHASRVQFNFYNYLGLQSTCHTKPKLDLICAHAVLLRAVFDNLIKNSIEALEYTSKAQIRVSVHQSDNEVFVDIQDNGCGMSSSLVREILKKSPSPSLPCNNKKKGHGLGLRNCLEELETWGARLEIMSRRGRGTCMTLCFPLISRPEKLVLN